MQYLVRALDWTLSTKTHAILDTNRNDCIARSDDYLDFLWRWWLFAESSIMSSARGLSSIANTATRCRSLDHICGYSSSYQVQGLYASFFALAKLAQCAEAFALECFLWWGLPIRFMNDFNRKYDTAFSFFRVVRFTVRMVNYKLLV